MIDAIFFDQDNTLVNTREVAEGAYRKALKTEEMWQKWVEVKERVKGSKNPGERTFEYSLNLLLGQGSGEVGEMLRIYKEELLKNIKLNKGVKEFFEGPKIAKYYILMTEDFDDQIEIKLGKFGLREKFDLIIGSREVGAMKPDINYFKIGWNHFDIDPSQCVYVGDNYEKDCAMGVEAGGRSLVFGQDFDDFSRLSGMISPGEESDISEL